MPYVARAPEQALGIWALVCAILAPVWLFAGFHLVIFAMADTAPVALVVLANIAAFGWLVAVVVALVLGIVAILFKRGNRLGIAALVALLLIVAVSFGAFS